MKLCTIITHSHITNGKPIRPQRFQTLILSWFDQHGRKHLPWQQNKTPYRVWVSEIMLQQTQVNTVIPYYEQFMQRFPDLFTLANASEDDVLHAWAGLGYYSRARNLHRAAKMILHEFDGLFPNRLENVLRLPGIGRSTAAAIMSIVFHQPTAILDGNVKRVLARLQGITQPINEKTIENELWDLAEKYMPLQRTADYTQAMMDLGATLCVRKLPNCIQCPLNNYCIAYQQNLTHLIPQKKSKRKIPVRSAVFLIFQHQGQLLLNKRPSAGIWGGLWSFPELLGDVSDAYIQAYCQKHFSFTVTNYTALKSFRHTFSHYHLDISPVLIPVNRLPCKVRDLEELPQIWYNPTEIGHIGLPKPVQMIIDFFRTKELS